jgi:Domain of unknown function (DUF5666)
MNRITKVALTIPAVLAVVGGVAFTQVAAGTLSQAATPTATPSAQVAPNGPGGAWFGQMPQRPGAQGPRGGSQGKVTAVSDNSVSIQVASNETLVVNTTSSMTVTLMTTKATGSLSDIKVGDNVAVRETRNSDGSFQAQQFDVFPAGDRLSGPVGAVNGTAITINNPRGNLTVNTDANTKVMLADGKAGSLSDVTAGTFVDAYGQKQSDGSLTATYVLISNHQGRGPGLGGPGRGGPRGKGFGQPPQGTAQNQAPTVTQ